METNEELEASRQNEFTEIDEKDLNAVSGGCGTSTPEPEPDPYACEGGGSHEVSCPGMYHEKWSGTCDKCNYLCEKDEAGVWKRNMLWKEKVR